VQWNTKAALVLAVVAIMDAFTPAPIAALFAIYVLLAKPPFVKAWVDRLYADSPSS
jgi:hypothetical protein